MNISENTLVAWSKGPSDTEIQKCENAEGMVKKAINADDNLRSLDISVFAQGSYKAHTNVRQNSDVDICIRYNTTFFPQYPTGKSGADYGHSPGTMDFYPFKNMVQHALESYFGRTGVTRGNKAFDIHANTYRIDADVVPTFEHRRYAEDGSNRYLSGVKFISDDGVEIINWPQQSYDNGVTRNLDTGRKYKRVIRILKRLRDKMQEDNIIEAMNIPSFLIECLVWNTDLYAFSKDSYTKIVEYVLLYLWSNTRLDESCNKWVEVNELKYLYYASQPWTRQQANNFLLAAYQYMGYK